MKIKDRPYIVKAGHQTTWKEYVLTDEEIHNLLDKFDPNNEEFYEAIVLRRSHRDLEEIEIRKFKRYDLFNDNLPVCMESKIIGQYKGKTIIRHCYTALDVIYFQEDRNKAWEIGDMLEERRNNSESNLVYVVDSNEMLEFELMDNNEYYARLYDGEVTFKLYHAHYFISQDKELCEEYLQRFNATKEANEEINDADMKEIAKLKQRKDELWQEYHTKKENN